MKRFIVITVSLYLAACVSLCYILAARPQNKIKNTEANDIIFTVREYWPDVEQAVKSRAADRAAVRISFFIGTNLFPVGSCPQDYHRLGEKA